MGLYAEMRDNKVKHVKINGEPWTKLFERHPVLKTPEGVSLFPF
jgi:hypothetical protein